MIPFFFTSKMKKSNREKAEGHVDHKIELFWLIHELENNLVKYLSTVA